MLPLLLAGCLGSAPATDGGTDAHAGDAAPPDALAGDAAPPDLARPFPDLAGVDLTGLVNCYGASLCDPTMQLCIRYYAGSQGAPGDLVSGPACYEPTDTCANQQQNMDCGCIQIDMNLGGGCQGSCLDHGDGTFDCFAS